MNVNLTAVALCTLIFARLLTEGATTCLDDQLRLTPERRDTSGARPPGCREASLTRLRIGVNTSGHFPPIVTKKIHQSVDEVWGQYGLAVDWSATSVSVVPRDADLVFLVQLEPIAEAPNSLGAVIFGRGGPSPIIQLSASTAIRWIKRSRYPSLGGRDVLQVDQAAGIVGSVLGRAAAHELGHVLLSTKSHASVGLMQSGQSLDPLSSAAALVRLDVANERRLTAILGEAPPCSNAAPW
jgi:hypothetical protein